MVGAFFRLYKITGYMTFLGDEGRDAIVVRRLLVNGDPILIGPGTSIGNMYLGPLYYYLIAPSLLLANFSPVGPSLFVAVVGIATIGLIYWIAREWYGKIGAWVAAGLYAISPTVIIFSRSSWNPNVMPFFALLTIYSIWRVWQKKQFWWVIVTGVCFAATLQSHYLALALAPVIGLFWLLTFLKLSGTSDIKDKAPLAKFLNNSVIALVLFLLLMSPLALFDYRHGWNNFNAIKTFFFERQTTVSARPWTAFPKIPELLILITNRLLAGYNNLAAEVVLAIVSIPSIIMLLLRRRLGKNEVSADGIVFLWLGVALLSLGLYKQHIYDHYFGFFFAAPFLILGGFVAGLYSNFNTIGRWILAVAIGGLVILNLNQSPLKYPPNMQLSRSVNVAKRVAELAGGEKFNFAVIAERNYEGAYQYFFEKDNVPFVIIDPQRLEETTAKQLFVVCELPEEKCDPTHNPKTEVAAFGWSTIENQWQEFGVTIYKLVHSQQ